MSLKYAPNLSSEQCEAILREEDTCVLGLCTDSEPYVVPVSYAFLEGRLVVHCAKSGKKLDILRANPRVSFTVFRHPDRVKPHPEGTCTYRFESVIGSGSARIVEDPAERLALLNAFQIWFDNRLGLTEHKAIAPQAVQNCACFVIEIETLTGRKKG